MRIIILGVSGLLGHKLLQELSGGCEVFGTLHSAKNKYGDNPLFAGENIIESIDVTEFDILKGVLCAINPDVILNCVGITIRKNEIKSMIDVLNLNSLFPHQLANWAKTNNKRVIHFSTDCVFDGKIGNYTETSIGSAEDTYGKTKFLGEINYDHTLTLRSSFIGRELFGKTELLEWFLAQDGKQIKGFTKTFYSGVSTIFMSKVVKNIILNYPNLSGLYNLAPEKPISKYDLLCLAKNAFNVNIDIIADDRQVHLKTLDGAKLKKAIGLEIPGWEKMMTELASTWI